jgi:hypothetical protein
MMNYCEEDDDGDTNLICCLIHIEACWGKKQLLKLTRGKAGKILEKTKNEIKIEIWMSS